MNFVLTGQNSISPWQKEKSVEHLPHRWATVLGMSQSFHCLYVMQEETVWGGLVSPTITGDHQNRITDYTAIVIEKHEKGI